MRQAQARRNYGTLGYSLIRRFLTYFRRQTQLHALLGLILGVTAGLQFSFTKPLADVLDLVVESYGFVAPVVMYLILAPGILGLKNLRRKDSSAVSLQRIMWWIVGLRLGACLLAVMVAALAFSLPVSEAQTHETSGWAVVRTFGQMMLMSPYFYAIYAAILTCALAWRKESPLIERFIRLPEWVESLGGALTTVTPLFTFLVGIYVTTLPDVLAEHFAGARLELGAISVCGVRLDVNSPGGILILYLTLALLTGAVCTVWHFVLLILVRQRHRDFSLRQYFFSYFVRVYPLLWATSSEALATPLNMHLVKENYPDIPAATRHLMMSVGSIFNINGTLICCFIMVPATCALLNQELSILSLLMCVPVIYVLGFGVPGIPGELVLFAGPLIDILGIPEPVQASFLLVFIGLQVGLPDSFRTGANSTDDCPTTLLVHDAGSVS